MEIYVKRYQNHDPLNGIPQWSVVLLSNYQLCIYREEHKSHSGKCAFLTHKEDELTVRQFLEFGTIKNDLQNCELFHCVPGIIVKI